MPHFYRIRTTASPVATNLDIVDVLVLDRAGYMAYFAAGEQRLLPDRDVVRSAAWQLGREREAPLRRDLPIVATVVLDEEDAKATQTHDLAADAEAARLARDGDIRDIAVTDGAGAPLHRAGLVRIARLLGDPHVVTRAARQRGIEVEGPVGIDRHVVAAVVPQDQARPFEIAHCAA